MAAGIRRFANHQGATQKYHHTLTLAWMRLVAAALVETPEGYAFEQFLAAHADLGDKNVLAKYYSNELMQTNAAREGWVEPDLQPLPELRIYAAADFFRPSTLTRDLHSEFAVPADEPNEENYSQNGKSHVHVPSVQLRR
jgi:hypothetical protein